MPEPGLLAEQGVLVVGAGSGIGRAVAERLASEGALVVGLDLDGERLGDLPLADRVVGDACAPSVVAEAVERAEAAAGRLDSVVCCAGRFDFYQPICSLSPSDLVEAFEEIYRVNVLSGLVVARVAAEALRASRGSLVLTVSSSARWPEGGGVLYGSSKWAVRGLVAHLARELAPEVRVNGVAPGGTARTRLVGLRSLGQDGRVADGPERDERIAAQTLLGVAASPADHAGTYLYLVSRALSPLVTGTVVPSDGGRGERIEANRTPRVGEERVG
ncbi:SDR family oxidoreductase [Aciditerrimonas ferrireducens]|uniref:SDR family oxidoreductase n=1 Tax=Aciditerrimonas ferrireducens TaxID=667306 RepID=UPI002003B4A9|nr:SDR family oxidoreductase [Aciditerrimonas ferrireducens]MCK4177043.1 SDR family oxidoreductase [Aciditerrimonas ferrireducens]